MRIYLYYIVNIIDADVVVTQGAGASTNMILTMMVEGEGGGYTFLSVTRLKPAIGKMCLAPFHHEYVLCCPETQIMFYATPNIP